MATYFTDFGEYATGTLTDDDWTERDTERDEIIDIAGNDRRIDGSGNFQMDRRQPEDSTALFDFCDTMGVVLRPMDLGEWASLMDRLVRREYAFRGSVF